MKEIPRDVFRTDDFQWAFAQIEADEVRADELWRGIEWTLARWPELGNFVVKLALTSHGPFVKVYATITEESAIATLIEMERS